ncbi:anti-sigma factor [Polaribacter batillariae]|uniref:Anti-sigma factor n=1 Tax=Polaribacter batillariae TaxID=2808900 RepID=A0ABX7SX77_9FLAO|nr:anti-sigma factor [Polaribacter batillariae]QTD37860.1 anti-sigma factor [Polaribacter batillariae]
MKKVLNLAMVFALTAFFAACSNDDNEPTTGNLTVNLDGLEELGADFVYEGWLIVNGNPVSTGTFTSVDFPQTFTVGFNNLEAATKFVLSIEPKNDPDPAPSKTKILAGDFTGNSATVNSNIVGDFSDSWGRFILATPTDGMNNNERSGVWFLTPGTTPPTVGLGLPELEEGWKYEGWAVINGKPVTTGKFTKLSATDEFDGFSGPMALPAPNGADGFFPGEDFLVNAPDGLTFPVDLRGATIVISVEPSPDDSPAPFALKPLAKVVAADAVDHAPIELGTGPKASISGSVSRN